LLEVLLQGGVGLLGGGDVTALQFRAELAEKLADGTILLAGVAATSVMVMMVRLLGLPGLLILEVLLNVCVGLLGGRKIAGL
jgi:hypothetical protein